MPTIQEALAEAPIWLREAHNFSTAKWANYVLELDSLRPFRIDETEGGYQRPISQSRVQDLVEKFDAGEAREIYVSQRADDSRWILDGQHTWAALTEMGITHWPCRVFFGLTVAEEAQRFAEYQSNTRRIPPVVQFNAEVVANSPVAVALDKILSEFYLRISSSKMRSAEGYIPVTSRAAYQKLYELGGPKLLREVLQLVIDVWGHQKATFRERILQGLGWLLAYTEGEYDRQRMIAVLKNTTVKSLVEAIGPTGSGGAARSGAVQIYTMYMEGVPGYPAIRKNAKEAPKIPDTAPKEGPQPHEYWTDETSPLGRVTVGPLVKHEPEPKAPKPEKAGKAEKAETEPQAAASEEPEKAATEEATQSEGPSSEEEDDWTYPDSGAAAEASGQ